MSFDSILINLATPICVVSAALAAIGGWTAFSGIIDGIQGVVTGKIVLEDGKSPSLAKITFNGSHTLSVTPDLEGNFSVILPRGKYDLTVEAQNYLTVIKSSRMLHGRTTDQLNEIKLIVAPKDIEIHLVDQSGAPYKNVSFALLNTHQQKRYETRTNNLGAAELNNVGYGRYEFIMGSPTPLNESFIWTKSFFNPIGIFEVVAAQSVYELKMPRIVYAQQTEYKNTKSHNISGEKFIAQPFKTSNPIKICGVGLSVNTGKQEADRFQLRSDSNSLPGSLISETNPLPPNAATSYAIEGIFGEFCKKSAIALQPGTYWLIAEYKGQTEITLTGEEHTNDNLTVLTSNDGLTWRNSPIQKLNFFLVE